MTRKVLYVTGTRADFGLMEPTLRTIAADPRLQLGLVVTGMHLSERFGLTACDIARSGLPVVAEIPVDLDTDSGLAMAVAAGEMLVAFARAFAAHRPDIVLVLGDRLEMLSAAIAATCTDCAAAHLHGGERSGTIDESIRHAVSKLAHFHFTTTAGSAARLERMGEAAERIAVVGAPGLVGIERVAAPSRAELARRYELDPGGPIAAVLFHPVVQDADRAGKQAAALFDALADHALQAVCLLPNADAGNSPIRDEVQARAAAARGLRPITHLERSEYLALVAGCDVLVGNSSSGILEAGSFGTPVVNIGERQTARERNPNVIDVGYARGAISAAIGEALVHGRYEPSNLYFQPETDRRVADLLASVPLDRAVRKKLNTY